MKKFIIAMIAVVLGLSSCSKESKLLGSWQLETIATSDVSIGASALGANLVATFKDGNVLEITGYEEPLTSGYTVKGNKLYITELEEEFEFEVKQKKLTLTTDLGGRDFEAGDFDLGGKITLTFKKL